MFSSSTSFYQCPGWKQKALAKPTYSARSRPPPQQQRDEGMLSNKLKGWLKQWSLGIKSSAYIVRDAHNYVQDEGKHKCYSNMVRLAHAWNNIQNSERVVESLMSLEDMMQPQKVRGSAVEWYIPPYDTFHGLTSSNF